MVSDAEIKEFCHFVKKLKLDFSDPPEEFDYNNPVLIIVDAVLSMNRRYESFVVPRIKLLKKEKLVSLRGLKSKIDKLGIKDFCKLWNYNHPERVDILRRLLNKFLQIKKSLGVEGDLEALLLWGRQSMVDDFNSFNVRGIGFTTYQYLRMMCRAETTKPDVHLKKAAQEGIKRRLSEKDTVFLVEEAAKKSNFSVRQFDYALWKHYSKIDNV